MYPTANSLTAPNPRSSNTGSFPPLKIWMPHFLQDYSSLASRHSKQFEHKSDSLKLSGPLLWSKMGNTLFLYQSTESKSWRLSTCTTLPKSNTFLPFTSEPWNQHPPKSKSIPQSHSKVKLQVRNCTYWLLFTRNQLSTTPPQKSVWLNALKVMEFRQNYYRWSVFHAILPQACPITFLKETVPALKECTPIMEYANSVVRDVLPATPKTRLFASPAFPQPS